jgi:hypothetical protein
MQQCQMQARLLHGTNHEPPATSLNHPMKLLFGFLVVSAFCGSISAYSASHSGTFCCRVSSKGDIFCFSRNFRLEFLSIDNVFLKFEGDTRQPLQPPTTRPRVPSLLAFHVFLLGADVAFGAHSASSVTANSATARPTHQLSNLSPPPSTQGIQYERIPYANTYNPIRTCIN